MQINSKTVKEKGQEKPIEFLIKFKGMEYLSRVRKLSTSGYIPAPKALIGKKVRVTILEE